MFFGLPFRENRYRWKSPIYEATGGSLDPEADKYIEHKEEVDRWIRKHIRYDQPSFFNDSPITVHRIRNFYEHGSGGKKVGGYLSKADMARALERCGFPAVGCYGDGWYFEVKIIQ